MGLGGSVVSDNSPEALHAVDIDQLGVVDPMLYDMDRSRGFLE